MLLGDSIRYTNVISKGYYFHYKDMNQIMEQFASEIVEVNATVKGPLFYSINNVPMDEMIYAELFMPVYEDKVELKEDMYYHSYYNIENMITIGIHEQFETTTEVAYATLMHYMETNQLKQITPIFHIMSGDTSMQYVFIKIGVFPIQEEKKELVWKD